jgi:hypothetical protein
MALSPASPTPYSVDRETRDGVLGDRGMVLARSCRSTLLFGKGSSRQTQMKPSDGIQVLKKFGLNRRLRLRVCGCRGHQRVTQAN